MLKFIKSILCLGLITQFSIWTEAHILDNVLLVDGHNDLTYNIYTKLQNNLDNFRFEENLKDDPEWGLKNCSTCFTDLPRLKQGKVGGQFWVAYAACEIQYKDALSKTLEQIDVVKRFIKKYSKDLAYATSVADIKKSYIDKKIASLIAIEGGHSMDSRLSVLRMFYDLGVRYMTLTHTCNTPWADNSFVDDSTPVHNLTAFGMLVVKEMNRLGMLVDLSHVSHAVMNQAISISRAPVIFSHSSAYSVNSHNRNVRDDTLKLVKKNNGVVMVNFFSEYIIANPDDATIETVAEHVNWIANVAGMDHVGIGGDYDGANKMPKGLEDVSKYPDLFSLLQKQNATKWTDENLAKLASGNFMRVFTDVEKIRDDLVDEQPYQNWIDRSELDAVDEAAELWKCRTLLNNKSPIIDSNN